MQDACLELVNAVMAYMILQKTMIQLISLNQNFKIKKLFLKELLFHNPLTFLVWFQTHTQRKQMKKMAQQQPTAD